MGKKLAIIFPGIGYTSERPLLYYSRKVLQKNGYEVTNVDYTGLDGDNIFESSDNTVASSGQPVKRVSKDKTLKFVAKAEAIVKNQLDNIDFSQFDKIMFVSKSVGAVVSAVYAKQVGIKPYHIMITPLDYAFQFVDEESGSVFCGTEDPLANFQVIKNICKEKMLDCYDFKAGNHSLETDRIDINIDYLKQYVSIIDNIISDMGKCIYDFDVLGREQQIKSMSEYKGKVLLIVNTATGCGFTPQYHNLEKIYKKYQGQGFEILDFPCNQFDNQAPGTEKEIYSFCTSRYDISFEQFAKIHVNGEKQSELYEYLKSRKGFKGFDMSRVDSRFLANKLEKSNPGYELTSDIKWNFTKFLVNRKGQIIERFEPTTDMELVETAIQQIL